MSLLGKGLLAIWNGIDQGAEDDFLKWHVHEHIPERVALPGFLRGRRYVAVDGFPKFFNFYETSSTSDLMSATYRQALNSPSDWTRDVVRLFTNTSRTICEVVMTEGLGEGAFIETLRLQARIDASEFRAGLAGKILPAVARQRGVVGTHLLEGLTGQHTEETAEMRLRGGRDETAAWIILIETVQTGVIESLRKGLLSDGALTAAGADPVVRRGAYALQFSLARSELDGKGVSHRSFAGSGRPEEGKQFPR